VLCGGRIIETLDVSRACSEAHEGAVLLHMGETYLVDELDLQLGVAKAKRQDVDYYTEALKLSDVRIKSERAHKTVNGITVHLGEVKVTEQYYEYAVRRYEKLVGYFPLDLPPQTFESVAFWFTLSPEFQEQMLQAGGDFNGGIHAVEHGMIAMAPLYALCDRWDLGGLSTPLHPDTGVPPIFVYDGYEGGIGIAEKCYELFPELTKATTDLIKDCECEVGCPACIYSPKCGNKNSPLDKAAALKILAYMSQEPDNTPGDVKSGNG
jgi:DEAD/DEAH box helicase domain-containing protein